MKESKEPLSISQQTEILIKEEVIPQSENDPKKGMLFPDVDEILVSNREKTKQNNDVLDLFPLARTSLNVIKSIVINGEVNYSVDLNLPPSVQEEVTSLINRVLKEKYLLHEEPPTIIDEMLFEKGSVAYLTLPRVKIESLVQQVTTAVTENDVVNVSEIVEEFSHSKGLPNKRRRIINVDKDTKSAMRTLGFSITDTPETIFIGEKIDSIYKSGGNSQLLAVSEMQEEFANPFKTIINKTPEPNIVLDANDELDSLNDNAGDGLHMKLVTENLIPLHIDSDKNNPMGYLFVVNEDGKPINTGNGWLDMAMDFNSEDGSTKELKKLINAQRDKLVRMTSSNVPELKLDDMFIYDSLVNEHINKVLKKAKINGIVGVQDTSSISGIMFMRALKAKQTNIIYIPAEYVTYYTFRKRHNGIGKSLLEDASNLISMYGMLTLAKLRSDIENAIPPRLIEIEIDDEEEDIEKVMGSFIEGYQRSFNRTFNWGTLSMAETADWIQNINTTYRFKHRKIAYHDISETINNNMNSTPIDDTYIDKITKDIVRSFGLNLSMLDSSADVEFAAVSVLANDISKLEMIAYQNKLINKHTEHAIKLLRIDSNFTTGLKQIVEKNINVILNSLELSVRQRIKESAKNNTIVLGKYFMNIITDNVVASLPPLLDEEESKLKNRFDEYKTSVQDAVDEILIVNDSLLANMVGEKGSEVINIYRDSIANQLIRKWMLDHNYMVEVVELLAPTDTGDALPGLSTYVTEVEKLALKLRQYSKYVTNEELKNLTPEEIKESKIIGQDYKPTVVPKGKVEQDTTKPTEDTNKPTEDTPPIEEDTPPDNIDELM